MLEHGAKFPPQIQEARDSLAEEIVEMRKERDAKRKGSQTLSNILLRRSKGILAEADAINAKTRTTLKEGKDPINKAIEEYTAGLRELGGANTDHNLIRWYYKQFHADADVYPIATDSFIGKSREEYNAAWLARELVQNFVDHNPIARGTLDGVSITKEDISEDGSRKRYTITGDWVFEDPTGVISPHSEKPADTHTAGGNGIGLKQTAIRYLRDFGVHKFEIKGENWTADYQLVKAEEVNERIGATVRTGQEVTKKMRHDWLVGHLKKSEDAGKCTYVIETDNPEVMSALDQLEEIGVSERNTFLQNPDFKNKFGTIKWILPGENTESRGRLFINGQVMNFGDKGTSAENYWVGPEYVTLQLNDTPYKISVDRPPLKPYELGTYISKLLGSMSVEESIDQLKRSEPIWTTISDTNAGASIVISALVRNLSWNSNYKKENFAQYFGDKKYVARDRTVSISQERDLLQQGYIFCPSEFENIGMRKAGSLLGNIEIAASQKPNMFSAGSGIEKLAEESGIQVAYEDFSDLKPEEFMTLLCERSVKHGFQIVFNPDSPSIVRLQFDSVIPKELLTKILSNPKTEEQKILSFVRGIAFKGLSKYIFKRIFFAQGDYVTTFDTSHDFVIKEDVLLVRNIKTPSDKGVFVEFEFEDGSLRLGRILENTREDNLISTPKDGRTSLEVSPVPASKNESQLDRSGVIEERWESPTGDKSSLKKPGREIAPVDKKGLTILEEGDVVRTPKVIVKERDSYLTPEQVSELEVIVPGVTEAIRQLDNITTKIEQPDVVTPLDKYLEWRDSNDRARLAEEDAGYLDGRTLGSIVNKYNQADIAVVDEVTHVSPEERAVKNQLDYLNNKLEESISRMNPDGGVDDFEMMFSPKPEQLARLGLLRRYAYAMTGARIENQLFIFKGTGASGINIGREAIGLHEEVLKRGFLEAFGVFVHELAHNESMDHGPKFMTAMEAIFLESHNRLMRITQKQEKGFPLNEDEAGALEILNLWDELEELRGSDSADVRVLEQG